MTAGVAANGPPAPVLEARGLVKHFPVHGGILGRETGRVHAVDGVDLSVARGRTLGLVGESGCGKSTVGRLLLRLIEPDAGSLMFEGRSLLSADAREMRAHRARLQIIFQDPFASLNPRLSVGEIVEEPLIVHGMRAPEERREHVLETLRRVGLRPELADRYPHEFSGGQRQRIGIARAIVLEPALIVADEPVSALDVSVQASVINLLTELQNDLGIAFVMIAHDLAVVEHVSDEVAVMYLGRVVERATAETLYEQPLHPYTQALLAAIPSLDPHAARKQAAISGEVPSPLNPPPGCAFHQRCPHRMPICSQAAPPLAEVAADHHVACHLFEEPQLDPQMTTAE